jgi:hypothetical protein
MSDGSRLNRRRAQRGHNGDDVKGTKEMSTTKLIVLSAVATGLLSGVTASASSAYQCYRTEEANVGNYANVDCTGVPMAGGNYIRVDQRRRRGNRWCAGVSEPGTGNKSNSTCETAMVNGGWIWAFPVSCGTIEEELPEEEDRRADSRQTTGDAAYDLLAFPIQPEPSWMFT